MLIMVRFLSKRANSAAVKTESPSGTDPSVTESVHEIPDIDARDIMTRRNEMISLDGSMNLEDSVKSMLKSSKSYYPVYEDTVDAILGIITLKDAANEYIFHPENRSRSLSDIPGLIREAAIIPETREIGSIFQYMLAQKIRMMIVVDEYGQTSGLVTMDDIIDEIAGTVLEEYEKDEGYVLQTTGNSVVLDGMTPLETAEEVLRCDFPTEDYETLSGYLTSLLKHIPTAEDKSVTGNGFLFHILKTEHHTIRKVRAERLPGAGEE